MLNYMKAELYRLMHKKSNYLYYGVLFGLFSLILIYAHITNPLSAEDFRLIGVTVVVGLFPIFIGTQVFLCVYNDDLSARSLSKVLSSGISKVAFVTTKLLVACIYLVAICLSGGLVFLLLFFLLTGGFTQSDLAMFYTLLLGAVSTLLAVLAYISLGSTIAYVTQRSSITIALFILLTSRMLYNILDMLSRLHELILTLKTLTISDRFNVHLLYLNAHNAIDLNYVLEMVIYLGIGILCSALFLTKKEIKDE